MPSKKVIKSILLSLFLLIAGGVKAFSFELFQFSVAPKYGLQYGQMNEYVLYTNGNTQSELIWQIEKMNLLGFNATMGWELLFLETNCMWGFPADSGQLLDSDWQNTSNYGMKTNYSVSSNAVDYLGNLELRIGLNIRPCRFLFIRPYNSISYEKIEFSATGGTYWYGNRSSTGLPEDVPYYDPQAKSGSLDSYGTVIDYKREAFNYNIGAKIGFKFLSRFTVSADAGISVFSAVNTVDHHIISKRYYLDKMQSFFKTFYFGAELDVDIWQGLSAGSSFNFINHNLAYGNDFTKKETSKTYTVDKTVTAAASGYTYNIEFFVRYSF